MSWTHIQDTTPKARKEYECLLCGMKIPKGAVHTARSGVGDDGFDTFRMHHACEEKTRKWDAMNWECHDCMDFRERHFPHNAGAVATAVPESNQTARP